MKLGFIGLGTMGRPMAQRLLRAGHELFVWARRPEAMQPLREAGAIACASPTEVGQHSEAVFTIVTHGHDVESLVLGPSGLLEGLRPGSVLVDMSTIAPRQARNLATRLSTRGIHMLDAPVSGGSIGAEAGTLSIMVGGESTIFERLKPVFEVLGKTLVHVGSHGSGQIAKACNQMVMVSAIQAAAEALHLATAAGLDPEKVREALLGGSAASRVMELFGGRMVRRDFQAGVEGRLHHKDFALIAEEALRLGVAMPINGLVAQQLNALVAQGLGHHDASALLCVLESLDQQGVPASLTHQ